RDADRLAGVVVEALWQLDLAENLGAIGERPHDEELAAFRADVELAVGHHERRLLDGAERLAPELAPGFEVERLQPRPVLDLIDARAVDDRRREAELVALHRPLRRLDVAGLRSVDRRD